MGVTGVDHEFRDVSRIDRRSVMPERFTKTRKGPIASEHVENPETVARNFERRREALQKCGHADFSIVSTLLRKIEGRAAATCFLILKLPREPVHLRDMPLGVI